ncbi:hypothetical protein M514_09227 [Trichuris suis]|uniref:Methyltransferase domain-containing protein n=1 Tax=Trichuris suis TaxID=68888 RepID=A0A085LY52_9BILA|nr:hypothetical protein M513_09227 [Trichuris suis]KFD70269.1 hypothetical protein M514_09227 [Trichuris suis]KHJ40918.1 hypothetical protein D918_09028 [Trichuris suis]
MRVSLFRLLNASLRSAVLLAVLFYCLRKVRESTSPQSQWGLSKPPPCETLEHEFARFNEFLAYPQFVCKNLSRVGAASTQFPLCADSKYGIDLNRTNFLMVSSTNIQDDLAFEHDLLRHNAAAKILVYSGSRYLQDVSNIKLRDRVLFARGLDDRKAISNSKHETLKHILDRLSSRKMIDILKVDSQLLRELVKRGVLYKVRILILVIRLDESSSHLVRSWYEALTSMFFENSMAVYVAKQSGDCSKPSDACKYTVGLINVSGVVPTLVRAPVAGLGSVEEELLRLYYFLNGPKHNCLTKVFPVTNEACYGCESWMTCTFRNYDDKCAVLYFGSARFGDCAKAYSLLRDDHCTVYVFDPSCGHHDGAMLNLQFFNVSLINYSPDMVLSLLPHDIIIDKIFVDLQGSEWDMLGELLASELFKLTRQILLLINLWTGEEAENIRRMFGWLYFHSKAGWQLFYVEQRQESCEKFALACRQRAYLQVGMTKG